MRVPDDWLDRATEIPDVSRASWARLRESVANDESVRPGRPSPEVPVDPRTGVPVVHSPARARRPGIDVDCVVCAGRTTGVIDRAPLRRGHTFINKNQYPLVFPGEGRSDGLHFLQWVSTEHDVDLDNMDRADLAVVLSRMGALEDRLYRGGGGHVLVIKNVGRLVGGSVAHGHQQIVHTALTPPALERDREFLERTGEPFARAVLRDAIPIREYEGRFALVVPPFMHRPLDMLIVSTRPGAADLRDLDDADRSALAAALSDATAAVVGLMPELGREVAYNLTFHNGIAGGLYVEVLPYTQERGGYEALGIDLCAGSPGESAERITRFLR